MTSLGNQGYIAGDSPSLSSWATPMSMPFPWSQPAEAPAASPIGPFEMMMPRLPEYSYLTDIASDDREASVGDVSDSKKARAVQWIQPSGPRRQGQGIESEEQGIIELDRATDSGMVMVKVTLLAAGFIIGAGGASVRAIGRKSGAEIKSWTEQNNDSSDRPLRVFLIEGAPETTRLALEIINEAVDRYKYLCEGACVGKFVSRIQRIQDIEFNYQPPPRHLVPYAAALRGVTKQPQTTPPPVTAASQHQQGSQDSPASSIVTLQQQQRQQRDTILHGSSSSPGGGHPAQAATAMASAAMPHHLGMSNNVISDATWAPRSFGAPAGHRHHGYCRSLENMMPSAYFPDHPSTYVAPSMTAGLWGSSYPQGPWSSQGPRHPQQLTTPESAEPGSLPPSGDIWNRGDFGGSGSAVHGRRHLRQNSDPSMLLSSLARATMVEAPEHPNSTDAQRVTVDTSEVADHSKTSCGNSPRGGVLIPCNHNHDSVRHQQCRLDALCLGHPPPSSSYRQQYGIHNCGMDGRSAKGRHAPEPPGRRGIINAATENVATETATLLMSRPGDENYIEH